MDDALYKMIREMFADFEKVFSERHKTIEGHLEAIRVKQSASEVDRKRIQDDLFKMALKEKDHYKECPLVKEVTLIYAKIDKNKTDRDDELIDYKYFKRNPKMLMWILTGAFITIFGVLLSLYSMVENRFNRTDNKINTIENRNTKAEQKESKEKEVNYQEEIKSMNKN